MITKSQIRVNSNAAMLQNPTHEKVPLTTDKLIGKPMKQYVPPTSNLQMFPLYQLKLF